jgi:hypothetical protein
MYGSKNCTVVEGEYRDGKLGELKVKSESRRADVIICTDDCLKADSVNSRKEKGAK